ncbi:hypothetical protein FRC02_010854 [Tulasnella sp. 418]|nr:hypothetical protein FRC02_010854 [Tulasnella sp. 418]
MRSFIPFIALATLPTFILASPTPRDYGLQKREPTVEGLDLWDIHGGAVDYSFWTALGIKYAYVQATKSSSLKNQYFEQQYSGAGTAGIFRGAWHYAFPSQSDGKTQAESPIR